MFSYRHAFHAGNHADVLKHTMVIAMLRHLTQKETALVAVDTHAGAGLYRLDGDYAGTSGESAARRISVSRSWLRGRAERTGAGSGLSVRRAWVRPRSPAVPVRRP